MNPALRINRHLNNALTTDDNIPTTDPTEAEWLQPEDPRHPGETDISVIHRFQFWSGVRQSENHKLHCTRWDAEHRFKHLLEGTVPGFSKWMADDGDSLAFCWDADTGFVVDAFA